MTFFISRSILVCLSTIKWGFDGQRIFSLYGFIVFIGMTFLLTIAWSSVFTALPFLLKRPGRAVMGNILFLIFFPLILLAISALLGMRIDLSKFYMAQCMENLTTYTPVLNDILRGVFVSVFYTLIFNAAGFYIFNRKDI